MRTFLKHKKAKSTYNFKELDGRENDSLGRRRFQNLSSSLVTIQSSNLPQNLIQKKKQENTIMNKQTQENPKKSKYTHFPREEDFIGKVKNKIASLSPQKATLTKISKNKLSFLYTSCPNKQERFSVKEPTNYPSKAYIRLSKMPQQQKEKIQENEPPGTAIRYKMNVVSLEKQRICAFETISYINSKEKEQTEATVNFQEQLSSIMKDSLEPVLDLSFQMNQLLQRSQLEQFAKNQEQSQHAVMELEKLLNF